MLFRSVERGTSPLIMTNAFSKNYNNLLHNAKKTSGRRKKLDRSKNPFPPHCVRILKSKMAPTICVSEVPMVGTAVRTYVRRRQRIKSDVIRPRIALEEILRNGTFIERFSLSDDNCPQKPENTNMVTNYSVAKVRSKEYATNVSKSYRQLVEERRDLLSIVIRTIHLVRRNHLLQKRLDALRAETQRYLGSLSSDPKGQSEMIQMAAQPEEDAFMSSFPLDVDVMRHSSRRDCKFRTDGKSSSTMANLEAEAEVDSTPPER